MMTFDEWKKQMAEVLSQYPTEGEAALRANANKLRKALKEASPNGPHKKKKLRDGWQIEEKGYSTAGSSIDIKTISPHWHLVENGHVQYNHKHEVVGFVQGTHFSEKTKDSLADELKEQLEKKMYRALKRKGALT